MSVKEFQAELRAKVAKVKVFLSSPREACQQRKGLLARVSDGKCQEGDCILGKYFGCEGNPNQPPPRGKTEIRRLFSSNLVIRTLNLDLPKKEA